VQDRGLAAYVTELVGTMFLVFFITAVVTLYVATGANAQFGSDFAVVGLAQGFVLFVLIVVLGAVSGGHFNPAVTLGAAVLRRIDPVDAIVYMLAQLSGGVAGALLTKAFLLDEGRAGNYGATQVSPLIDGNLAGGLLEAIGTFMLVLAVCAVAFNPKARKEWAPLAIGLTLAFLVMVIGPLTGCGVNPARWFGPALVSNEFADVWPYVLGPAVGGFLAALFYKFVIEGAIGEGPPEAARPAAAPPTAGTGPGPGS
jgi:MIP family channel proteins